jgi:hypothetical protein
LAVAFEAPESGDGLKAVVDHVAAAPALTKDLPVFEPAMTCSTRARMRRWCRQWWSRMTRLDLSRQGVVIDGMPR